jgi:hypothetical protein
MSTDDRPTTPSARFERIEDKLDSLEQRVARVEDNQTHAKELQALQFSAFQKGQDAVLAKLDSLSAMLAAKDVEAARMIQDPTASPAGQAVMKIVNDTLARVSTIERKFYMAAGAVGLITFLAPIFGPAIRASFGLP